MCGDLLVAHIDDLDALVDAAVIDIDDVTAAQGEDGVHPLGLERLGDEVASGNDAGVAAFFLERVVRGGGGLGAFRCGVGS